MFFVDSVHLDAASRLSGEFLGALGGEQFLVVEGSESPRVLLPSDLAPVVCQFSLRGC